MGQTNIPRIKEQERSQEKQLNETNQDTICRVQNNGSKDTQGP